MRSFLLIFFCTIFSLSFSQIFNRPNVINSLVSPILSRAECLTVADNRVGQCMTKTACITTGGIIAGNCGMFMTCCIYQGSCRDVMNTNETYFVSPEYPTTQKDRFNTPTCIFTLHRNIYHLKWPICQIRLDFIEFSLAPPFNGTCGGKTDSFIISGASNFKALGLPSNGLCGDLTGQHLYIEIDPNDPKEPVLLIVNIANEQIHNRKWSIRIQQISCHSPFKAPAGCLQYFLSESGVIESFNFHGVVKNLLKNNEGNSVFNPKYFNYMNYGICIAQQPRKCGIRYTAENFDIGGSKPGVSGAGIADESSISACSFSDFAIGDYIIIPGGFNELSQKPQDRFCGQIFNSEQDSEKSSSIISFNKPFTIYVKTDNYTINPIGNGLKNQNGFQLKYEQIECKLL